MFLMRTATSAFLTALVAGQTAATSWNAQSAFSCPSTAQNACNPQQWTGFDWQFLGTGSFGFYNDFFFSGFSCADRFGKRDAVTKRTFRSKCITATLAPGGGQGPSFGCSTDKKNGFSVDRYQVSVSRDTDIEFHYQMKDGSTCKHVGPCKAGGSIVQNTQCGGATSVTCRLPKNAKQSCDIAIHNISFRCNANSSGVPPASKSAVDSVAVKSSAPMIAFNRSTASSVYIPTTVSTLAPSISVVTSIWAESDVSSMGMAHSLFSIASEYADIASPSTSTLPVAGASSNSVDTNNVGTTPETLATILPSSPTSAYVADSSFCHVSSVVTGSTTAPPPSVGCPDVLPRCLNTWMHSCSCRDNTDYRCYCPNSGFTENVMDCIVAWAVDDGEAQEALSFFAGICASYVPQNPSFITNFPKSIALGVTFSVPVLSFSVATIPFTRPATVTSGAPARNHTASQVDYTNVTCAVSSTVQFAYPVTTITIASTYTVQCTYSTGESAGLPIPGSSTAIFLQTRITVPQVAFTTVVPMQGEDDLGQHDEAPSIGLVAATTPAPVPANATAAVTGNYDGYASVSRIASSDVAAATMTAPAQFMGAASGNKDLGGFAALVAGVAALII